MKFSNSLNALLAAAMLTILPATSSHAVEVTSAEDGKRKINLSGRQRMLSQRMAKAVCFAAQGVQIEKHLKMIENAHALFDTTLIGLREGDAEQGLNPEKTPRILSELDDVEGLWTQYGVAVAAAAKGKEAAQAALDEVASLNLPTLIQMNKAVGEFERHYGSSGDIHPALALALNISGRQRMLSQKASKEFCLIAAGKDVEENRTALAKTVALFESSLLGLMDGNEDLGLPEAPTDEIYEQLEFVMELWVPLKSVFAAVANGSDPSDAELKLVATGNNPLLVEMNRAVWMYDQI